LRVEWCRSRTYMKHALEEVRLVKEEMAQTLGSLEKRSEWWHSRAENRAVEDPRLQEGLQGYAKKQAYIQGTLATSFQALW
ncbi:hypothetical protein BT96DRAFT_758427, partial [Gymnopus androsaceus JB14]